MVSAKRIESFDFATMYRVFNNGFQLKELKLSICRQCIEFLAMASAIRFESFDFATMYSVFKNGFS